ncbi:M28 family peptidase [Flavobacteriaceae bacterium S0825]|uniref:M28 family peptidase n=1 Tax=Gaetbulibacter sp. S0825 TaxID=2720084 RepID=UPI0014304108|nr:M28 family peptidase [Gaetbulibacter sp. S0825]MCK0107810.1 M28 family peptidase [Flavobacteriaceae bacterium S0825]NIX63446.1 M28 family peptidase [Gaetbulibacter sp. S0825]
MNKLTSLLILTFFVSCTLSAQTVSDLMNFVSQDTLTKVIREFSGEDPTVVNGSTVTILNRESANNDVAADYLKERLSMFNNLTINDQAYTVTYGSTTYNGRNIIATQLGKTNPNDIYIICAHYDSVDDFSVDDNASGTAAVLEIARVLSTQCFDNTIIYALWDEEEDGLVGSRYYANAAGVNGDNILGVLNLDMMAYDGDGDNDFDIDVRNIAGSLTLKDDMLTALTSSGLNLNANVVNPGSGASDHFWFWSNGFPAIFVGESWFNNDETPNYHTANDRFADLDMDYFTDLTKLSLYYMATKGSLQAVDNTVTTTVSNITANQSGATYQWLDCDNNMVIIPSETGQTFTPSSNGNYAVEITLGSCIEISNCVNYNTLELDGFTKKTVEVFPNPVTSILNIRIPETISKAALSIVSIEGKEVLKKTIDKQHYEVDFSQLANGIYFVNIENVGRTLFYKVVKE